MKIAFFGTPDFASTVLKSLINKHKVVCVITAQDRRRGRGKKFTPTPVKELAVKENIPILQPSNLKTEEFYREISRYDFDLAVVVAYGKIIPQSILDIPAYGFVNVHASLLPRWRGSAPIHRAILSGDKETGISIMKMDSGLDTGPVYKKISLQIDEEDTTGILFEKLAEIGSKALLEVIPELEKSEIEAVIQGEEGVLYAHKIEKSMSEINWNKTCKEIVNLIKALNPYPSAKTNYNGEMWKIFKASCIFAPHLKKNGEIISLDENGIKVACSDGYLIIEELQKSGAKKIKASEFLNGNEVKIGSILC